MYLSTTTIVAIVAVSALVLYVINWRIRGLERRQYVMWSALVELGYGDYSAYRAKTLRHVRKYYGLWPQEKDEPSLISVLISVGPDWFCLACGAVCATDAVACGRAECVEYVRTNKRFLHQPRRLKLKSYETPE